MKKIYNHPAVESLPISATFNLCGASQVNKVGGDVVSGGSESIDPTTDVIL